MSQYRVIVLELSSPTSTDVQATIQPTIELYAQTVSSLDLRRVIDAVNPSTRKRRKNAKEVAS